MKKQRRLVLSSRRHREPRVRCQKKQQVEVPDSADLLGCCGAAATMMRMHSLIQWSEDGETQAFRAASAASSRPLVMERGVVPPET